MEENPDNDGILDVPNLYQIDTDNPVDDLLTWYERSSNTLIMRPVVPLYEESTYAVVLTNRLVENQDSQSITMEVCPSPGSK